MAANEGSAEGHCELGKLWIALEDPTKAVVHHTKAVKLCSEYRYPHPFHLGLLEKLIMVSFNTTYSLGEALAEIGDFKGAVKYLEEALEYDEDDFTSHLRLGQILRYTHDHGACRALYD